VFDAPSEPAASGQGGAARDGLRGGFFIQPLALAAIGAAMLVGGLALVIAIGAPSGVAAGPDATAIAAETGVADGATGTVVVDVAGAVVTPGVYRLAAGARVGDAIEAAGGFGPRVDAARAAGELNLAATLKDGQQIRVPSRDDPAKGGGGTGGGGGGGAPGALIDLNSATQAELESLPGIGPVTAGKIVEARGQAPFRTIDELRERGLVGQKTFDSIRALISVG
jgi:competence protein ComEA